MTVVCQGEKWRMANCPTRTRSGPLHFVNAVSASAAARLRHQRIHTADGAALTVIRHCDGFCGAAVSHCSVFRWTNLLFSNGSVRRRLLGFRGGAGFSTVAWRVGTKLLRYAGVASYIRREEARL